MENNYIVSKANVLIKANYSLSAEAQKIILTVASMIQPEDNDLKTYELRVKDFLDLTGSNNKAKYKQLEEVTDELLSKPFKIKNEETDEWIKLNWVSSATYKEGKGYLKIRFDNTLKPYLLHLGKLYTSYKLENILQLTSRYSIRLYEILKSHAFKKQKYVEIDVEELKKMVGNNYKRYIDFKRTVILKSQKDLEKFTDIYFEFKEVKTGRRVTSIKFDIKNNLKIKDEITVTVDKKISDIDKIKAIFKEDITRLEAKKLLDVSKGNIILIEEKYKMTKQCSDINNVVGWVISAVKQDYKKPQKKINQDSFNDYEQREYDYGDLEKKLLGLG